MYAKRSHPGPVKVRAEGVLHSLHLWKPRPGEWSGKSTQTRLRKFALCAVEWSGKSTQPKARTKALAPSWERGLGPVKVRRFRTVEVPSLESPVRALVMGEGQSPSLLGRS